MQVVEISKLLSEISKLTFGGMTYVISSLFSCSIIIITLKIEFTVLANICD